MTIDYRLDCNNKLLLILGNNDTEVIKDFQDFRER